jgi:hypothetical protein
VLDDVLTATNLPQQRRGLRRLPVGFDLRHARLRHTADAAGHLSAGTVTIATVQLVRVL